MQDHNLLESTGNEPRISIRRSNLRAMEIHSVVQSIDIFGPNISAMMSAFG